MINTVYGKTGYIRTFPPGLLSPFRFLGFKVLRFRSIKIADSFCFVKKYYGSINFHETDLSRI